VYCATCSCNAVLSEVGSLSAVEADATSAATVRAAGRLRWLGCVSSLARRVRVGFRRFRRGDVGLGGGGLVVSSAGRSRRRRRGGIGFFGPGLAALAVRCAPPDGRNRDNEVFLGEAVDDATCDFVVAVAAGHMAMGESRGRGHRQGDKEEALVENHFCVVGFLCE